MEMQRSKIVNIILKEKDKVGELTLPDFKTYYKATVIKTVQCGTGERRDKKDHWNKIERPE